MSKQESNLKGNIAASIVIFFGLNLTALSLVDLFGIGLNVGYLFSSLFFLVFVIVILVIKNKEDSSKHKKEKSSSKNSNTKK